MTASRVLALVGGVALDGLDEVRDQVVAPLELDVDLRPGVLDAVPQADEAVVGQDDVQADDDGEHDQDDEDDGHGSLRASDPRVRRPWSDITPSSSDRSASPIEGPGPTPPRTRSRPSPSPASWARRGLESDVWLTADGEAVLDHDGLVGPRLRRRPIGSADRAALPSHIPTLEELYATVGTDLDLSLDIKDADAIDRAVAVARAAGAADRLWACHHDWKQVASWRRRYPEIRLVDSTRLEPHEAGPGAPGGAARRRRDRRREPAPLGLDRRAHDPVPPLRPAHPRPGTASSSATSTRPSTPASTASSATTSTAWSKPSSAPTRSPVS